MVTFAFHQPKNQMGGKRLSNPMLVQGVRAKWMDWGKDVLRLSLLFAGILGQAMETAKNKKKCPQYCPHLKKKFTPQQKNL